MPGKLLILLVRIYQRGISPLIGPSCRFQPTCSEYMVGSIRKYGAVVGFWRGALRVLRCHPFSRGGYDPP
ncbi:MAG: membrane protein insertion efficiency factor YidD [bacterium]|nr:membrane protein insertion efficiency factor YidD [bacterium]